MCVVVAQRRFLHCDNHNVPRNSTTKFDYDIGASNIILGLRNAFFEPSCNSYLELNLSCGARSAQKGDGWLLNT